MPQSYTKPKGKSQFMPDSSRYLFNIDTIHYTAEIFNYDAVMDAGLRDTLEHGKSVFNSGEHDELVLLELVVHGYDIPVQFEIMGGNRHMGTSYSIRNQDYALYFRKSDNLPQNNPVRVEINQFKLWSLGYIGAYQESLQLLIAMGFDFGKCRAARIDPCVHSDQWQWNLDDLGHMVYPRDVKKTNKPDVYGVDFFERTFETVLYGSRNTGLELRIYNKSLEAVKKNKTYFIDLYKERGLDPEKVWNIEFEIHRKYLKDFVNPDTFEKGFFDDMDNLLSDRGLSYLWSFLLKNFDHPSAHWQILKDSKITNIQYIEDKLLRHKQIDSSKEREVVQIYGRIQNLVINKELEQGKELESTLEILKELLKDHEKVKAKSFSDELDKKRRKYVDNQIMSLTLESSTAQLTGHVHVVDNNKIELINLKLQKSIHNARRKRDKYLKQGKFDLVEYMDTQIKELKDKQKALVSSRITKGS